MRSTDWSQWITRQIHLKTDKIGGHQFGVSKEVEMICEELRERIVGECGKKYVI